MVGWGCGSAKGTPMKYNILVTGGAGFIGTALVNELVKQNCNIIVLDNYSSGKIENHVDGVQYINDHTKNINGYLMSDSDGYRRGIKDDIDVVFHFGEYSRIPTSFDDIETVWDSNINGSFEVINYCRNHNIKIVYAGSSTRFAEEGVTHSPYSFTKSVIADLIKSYSTWFGLNYSICYFYNVFGKGYDSSPRPGYESVISVFEKQYNSGKPLTICGSGNQRRSFTYINDIVSGLIRAWHYKENNEFQLNNEKEYTILEIAKMFTDNIVHIDKRLGDRSTSITTNNNARELLGWSTTMNIDEWIRKIKTGE